MSKDSRITIVQPSADGSAPFPADASLLASGASAEALQERVDALQQQVGEFRALLDKPLSEILADREQAMGSAAAWDAFGAMWMLSQRAMRRVAVDLAAQQGVTEAEVVARAMTHANAVLNSEEEDLGATIAPAQMVHIERHKAFLRKQFR